MENDLVKAFDAAVDAFIEIGEVLQKAEPKLGTGKRFARLKAKLARRRGKGKIKDPAALAAHIGRKRWGKKRFQAMAARGRRRAG